MQIHICNVTLYDILLAFYPCIHLFSYYPPSCLIVYNNYTQKRNLSAINYLPADNWWTISSIRVKYRHYDVWQNLCSTNKTDQLTLGKFSSLISMSAITCPNEPTSSLCITMAVSLFRTFLINKGVQSGNDVGIYMSLHQPFAVHYPLIHAIMIRPVVSSWLWVKCFMTFQYPFEPKNKKWSYSMCICLI
jgi:hypothetical protein